MPELKTNIDTPDGRMETFVAYPLAEDYFVVLPNLHYRQTKASAPDYVEIPLNERIHYARHISNRLITKSDDSPHLLVDRPTAERFWDELFALLARNPADRPLLKRQNEQAV